jgi:hypothetical protein
MENKTTPESRSWQTGKKLRTNGQPLANKGVTLLSRDGSQLDELAYHLHGFGTHHLLHRHHLGLHERRAKDDACVNEASKNR